VDYEPVRLSKKTLGTQLVRTDAPPPPQSRRRSRLRSLLSSRLATPEPITTEGFVPIGGIEQWIAIRGRDRGHPAMLFLHGVLAKRNHRFFRCSHPGSSATSLRNGISVAQARRSGKIGASTPGMTLEQLTRDAVEVAQYVLNQLGIRKLILIGHSWGSMLGLCVVRSRPDLFHAFVGTGQVVSGRELVESWRLSALARARAAQDADAVAQLNDSRADDKSNTIKLELITKWMAQFTGSDADHITQQGSFRGDI